MVKKSIVKKLLVAGIASTFVGFVGNVSAAGFQLFEQNAVNLGDFTAGGAAIAEDASTAWFNPAGLTRICHQQLVGSLDTIVIHNKFNGTDVWSNNIPAPFGEFNPPVLIPGNPNVQGGNTNFVPAVHYAAPINNCLTFGLSVVAPFGLETNYPKTSILRYSATRTKLEDINISPSFGFKINNHLSIGAGFDASHLDVIFNQIAGKPDVLTSISAFDSESRNHATGWGYGWHAGLLYQFDPCTRVGVAYHSQINADISGRSTLIGPLVGLTQPEANLPSNASLVSHHLTAVAHLPPWTTLSFYHDFNPCFAMDASVVYTQWNKFNRNLILHNVQAVNLDTNEVSPTFLQFLPTQIDVKVPQRFNNTVRVAVGGIYRPTRCLTLRSGLGFENTPTNNTDRNIRLPDGNRFAVAVGGRYQINKPLAVDVGWTHLFIQNVGVHNTTVAGIQNARVDGSFRNHGDLFGAQFTWNLT